MIEPYSKEVTAARVSCLCGGFCFKGLAFLGTVHGDVNYAICFS